MIDGILEPVTVQRQRYLDFAEIVASLAHLAAQVDNSTPQEHLEELAALNAECLAHLAHLMTTAQPTSPPVDLGNGDSHAAAAADDLDYVAPLTAAVPADRDDVASLITAAPADFDDVATLITAALADPNDVAPTEYDDFASVITEAPAGYDDFASVITEAPADHDDVAYRDGLASWINADEGADQGAGDGAGGDHGAGYGSSHGRRTPWVPRGRPPRDYGKRVVTGFECVSQGCIHKRESEDCEYCAVHCLWPEEVSWPHHIEGLCKVHWLKPHRCQLNDDWCSNEAPKVPPLCDFQLCRKHCQAVQGSQHCKAHGIDAGPPRRRGNRTPGLRHLGMDRSAPYTGPKVKRNHR